MKRNATAIALGGIVLASAGVAGALGAFYRSRIRTAASIKRVTSCDAEYNLYRMDVAYDYDLDRIIGSGIADDQGFVDAVMAAALPLVPVRVEPPNFACSAFSVIDVRGNALMGRNYDFKNDTSAMLVHAKPKGGLESVAFAALDNLSANVADAGLTSRLASLAAPFLCLDGMNEKGVSIAVLTLDSKPTLQRTGKPALPTCLAIRLVLDRAATTAEAVDLLRSFDLFSTSGRDYHFYVTDATGDGRVIECDCDSPERPLVVTPTRTVTNFFVTHKDKVLPNQRNGVYGHGRERYDAIESILTEHEGAVTPGVAWQALVAASQEPNPDDVTSNTQWSIVYDDTNLTAEFVLRRDWEAMVAYDLRKNQIFGS